MNPDLLNAALGEAARFFSIEHLETCASTNTRLLEQAARGAASGHCLIADRQTAGRGRRGRSWVSSPGHSLTFSLLWRFGPTCKPAGLSLAIGLATAQALESLGFEGLGLKWPNDLWLYGRKLGGVLIESRFDERGFQAVIGIGLNLRSNPDWSARIDQAFTALDAALEPPAREVLLGTLLRHLSDTLATFEQDGFPALQAAWNQRNALQGLPVKVSAERGEVQGICGSANTDGALEILRPGETPLLIDGGDLSLRLDGEPLTPYPSPNGKGVDQEVSS